MIEGLEMWENYTVKMLQCFFTWLITVLLQSKVPCAVLLQHFIFSLRCTLNAIQGFMCMLWCSFTCSFSTLSLTLMLKQASSRTSYVNEFCNNLLGLMRKKQTALLLNVKYVAVGPNWCSYEVTGPPHAAKSPRGVHDFCTENHKNPV